MKKFLLAIIIAGVALYFLNTLTNSPPKQGDSDYSLDDFKQDFYDNNNNSSSSNDYNNNNNNNNNNGYSNEDVTPKPSNNGSSFGSGKVSLDTTGNYSGLRLKPISDRNDLICHEINKNTQNQVSRLTGNEEPLKVAVAAFNALKDENAQALASLYYPSSKSQSFSLDGNSEKFIAYKVLEYHKFNQAETEKVEKYARSTYNIADSSKVTGYYRVSFKVYKYDEAPDTLYDYKIYNADPFHFRVTVIEVDSKPYLYTYMTAV